MGLKLGKPGVGAEVDEGPESAPDEPVSVVFFEFSREDGIAPERSNFDEGGGEFDVLSSHLGGIAECAETVAEFETGVPDVADDVGDKSGVFGRRRGVVEKQEIEIGVGCDLASSATSDSDDRRLRFDLFDDLAGEGGKSLGDEIEYEGVGAIGEGADEFRRGNSTVEAFLNLGAQGGDGGTQRGESFERRLI